jgi:hypothetical protein
MSEFNPFNLHVFFNDKLNTQDSLLPRKYTLTHSDFTGDLFLSIGPEYDYKKFSGFYSRLLRDEVLGQWQNNNLIVLNLYCHVSGGIVLGSAKWRKSIFRHHMKMVIQAMCYGDGAFLKKNRDFLHAPIYVHFLARQKKLESVEKWGIINDYIP